MRQQGTCRPLRHPVWLDFGTRYRGTAVPVHDALYRQGRHVFRWQAASAVARSRPHWCRARVACLLFTWACPNFAAPYRYFYWPRRFLHSATCNKLDIHRRLLCKTFPAVPPAPLAPPPVQPGTPSQQFLAAGLSKRRPSLSSSD